MFSRPGLKDVHAINPVIIRILFFIVRFYDIKEGLPELIV